MTRSTNARRRLVTRLLAKFADAHVTVTRLPDGSSVISAIDYSGVLGGTGPLHVIAPPPAERQEAAEHYYDPPAA